MTTANLIKYGVIAALLVGLAVVYRSYGAAESRNQISILALADSKAETKALGDSLVAAEKAILATHARVDTLWRSATVYVERSGGFARAADSLIHLAPPDSLHACTLVTEALAARTSECEQLRAAVGLDSQAILAGQSQLRATEGTLLAVQARNRAIDSTLRVVSKPYTCHLLPFIPCPSRTVSFFVGALAVESLRFTLSGKP